MAETFEGPVTIIGNLEVKKNPPPPGGPIQSAAKVKTGSLVATFVSASFKVDTRDLNVTGDITLENADCAEEFDIEKTSAPHITPGTVVTLGDEGCIRHSNCAYDKRVAGVVSGGGNYAPGIVLDKRSTDSDRVAIALMGKVACNVDASYGHVEVGDLLTTSDTPGHAMKASDASRTFGAVIGKALRPLHEGRALVPILVALQ